MTLTVNAADKKPLGGEGLPSQSPARLAEQLATFAGDGIGEIRLPLGEKDGRTKAVQEFVLLLSSLEGSTVGDAPLGRWGADGEAGKATRAAVHKALRNLGLDPKTGTSGPVVVTKAQLAAMANFAAAVAIANDAGEVPTVARAKQIVAELSVAKDSVENPPEGLKDAENAKAEIAAPYAGQAQANAQLEADYAHAIAQLKGVAQEKPLEGAKRTGKKFLKGLLMVIEMMVRWLFPISNLIFLKVRLLKAAIGMGARLMRKRAYKRRELPENAAGESNYAWYVSRAEDATAARVQAEKAVAAAGDAESREVARASLKEAKAIEKEMQADMMAAKYQLHAAMIPGLKDQLKAAKKSGDKEAVKAAKAELFAARQMRDAAIAGAGIGEWGEGFGSFALKQGLGIFADMAFAILPPINLMRIGSGSSFVKLGMNWSAILNGVHKSYYSNKKDSFWRDGKDMVTMGFNMVKGQLGKSVSAVKETVQNVGQLGVEQNAAPAPQ